MPRGGKRLGAGRKPHTRRERWLGGNAGGRALTLVTPERTVAAIDGAADLPETVDAPVGITEAESAYWEKWAPLATARGLLHRDSAPGFALLCRWAAAADLFWACIQSRGLEQEKVTIDGAGQEHREYKANNLISQWRGAMARVEQLQARYGLAADGKVPVGAGEPDREEEALARLLAVK